MENKVQNIPENLNYFILNVKEPYVIKNRLNWEMVHWSLKDWESILKEEKLQFRCGKNSFTRKPQWERSTTTSKRTFNEFLAFTESEEKNWMYFDYKYLREWFSNIDELKKDIRWDHFGFPEVTSDDCTIWIGSKGAHTPCHMDTYGCNLVAQIYGSKQWLLFPPETNLKPTRIPYEESSIYSEINFFSPNTDLELENCRKIVLNPGDVLVVPHKWWHYVENLNVAISVNVWLPLPDDDKQRLEESLVQFLITQITNNVDNETKHLILNPNAEEDISKMTFDASVNLINNCKNICSNKINSKAILNTNYLSILQNCPFIQNIPKMSIEELKMFLRQQRNRFHDEENALDTTEYDTIFTLVNAFTHPDVVSLIKNKLLQN